MLEDLFEVFFSLFGPFYQELSNFISSGVNPQGEFYARFVIWFIIFLILKIVLGVARKHLNFGDDTKKPFNVIAGALALVGAVGIPALLLRTIFSLFGFFIAFGFLGVIFWIFFVFYKKFTSKFGGKSIFSFIFLVIINIILAVGYGFLEQSNLGLKGIGEVYGLVVTFARVALVVDFLFILYHQFNKNGGVDRAFAEHGFMRKHFSKLKKVPGIVGEVYSNIKAKMPKADGKKKAIELVKEIAIFAQHIRIVSKEKNNDTIRSFLNSGIDFYHDLVNWKSILEKLDEDNFRQQHFLEVNKILPILEEMKLEDKYKAFKKGQTFDFFEINFLGKLFHFLRSYHGFLSSQIQSEDFENHFPSKVEYKEEIDFAVDVKDLKKIFIDLSSKLINMQKLIGNYYYVFNEFKHAYEDVSSKESISQDIKNLIEFNLKDKDRTTILLGPKIMHSLDKIKHNIEKSTSGYVRKTFIPKIDNYINAKKSVLSLENSIKEDSDKSINFILNAIKNFERLSSKQLKQDSKIQKYVNDLRQFYEFVNDAKTKNNYVVLTNKNFIQNYLSRLAVMIKD